VRNLFLVLLLANLLLLSWVFWVDPEPPVLSRAEGAKQLAMLGQASLGANSSPYPGDASSQCLFIGPVTDLKVAQQLSTSLAERDIRAEPVLRERRVWMGHWVQIPGFADRMAAEAARKSLLEAGLPDAYVMDDGPVTIISLGVFRERGRAERVIEVARLGGFKAVMRERVRTAEEPWLVSDQVSGQQVALGELAAGVDRILRAEAGPCPAPLPDQ
jgi:hypothetical protein